MSESIPPYPTGYNSEAIFHQKTHRSFNNGPMNSRTAKFSRRHDGKFYFRVKPGKSAKSNPPKSLTFLQSLGDYILTEEGVAVAKPFKIRCSIDAETIYGTIYNYTYPHNPAGGGPSSDPLAYLYRVSTGGDPEYQGVNPEYLPGDTIYAIEMPDGTDVMSDPLDHVATPKKPDGSNGDPVDITWLQISTAAAWTAFSDQSFGH